MEPNAWALFDQKPLRLITTRFIGSPLFGNFFEDTSLKNSSVPTIKKTLDPNLHYI